METGDPRMKPFPISSSTHHTGGRAPGGACAYRPGFVECVLGLAARHGREALREARVLCESCFGVRRRAEDEGVVRDPRVATMFWCGFDDTRGVILYHKSRGGVEDLVVHLPRYYSMHGGRHVLFYELVAVQLQPLVVGELWLLYLGAHGFLQRCYGCASAGSYALQLRSLRWRQRAQEALSRLQPVQCFCVLCSRCSLVRQVAHSPQHESHRRVLRLPRCASSMRRSRCSSQRLALLVSYRPLAGSHPKLVSGD